MADMTKDTAEGPNDDPGASLEQRELSTCFVTSSSVSHAYDAYVHAYDVGASVCPYVGVYARPCRWCPYVRIAPPRKRPRV